MTVSGQFNKASASPNLLRPQLLRHRFTEPTDLCERRGLLAGHPDRNGRWTEIGLYNKTTTPIAIGTSNANNVNFASGTITLDDPTPPALSLSGGVPAFVGGDALGFQFAASDPESRARQRRLVARRRRRRRARRRRLRRRLRVRHRFEWKLHRERTLRPRRRPAHRHPRRGKRRRHEPAAAQPSRPTTQPPPSQADWASTTTTRTVTLLASDATSGIAIATLYADGAAIPTSASAAAGKPAGTLTLTGVIPTGQRLDGAVIDLAASDGATPSNTLDTRPGTCGQARHPDPPTAAPSAGRGDPGRERIRQARAAPRSEPATVDPIARTRGVTLRRAPAVAALSYGQRLWVTGKISVAPGATAPTRVLVIARPLVAAYAKRFSAHIITPLRADGTYAVRIRPNLISRLRVIALPATGPTHLAELTLGKVSVRARITNVRVTARGSASLTDPTISARVSPAVPGLRLSWLARTTAWSAPSARPPNSPSPTRTDLSTRPVMAPAPRRPCDSPCDSHPTSTVARFSSAPPAAGCGPRRERRSGAEPSRRRALVAQTGAVSRHATPRTAGSFVPAPRAARSKRGCRPRVAALDCTRISPRFPAEARPAAGLTRRDPAWRHEGPVALGRLSVRCVRPLLRIVAPGLSDGCQGHPQTRLRRARRSLRSLAPAGWGHPRP